MFWGVAGAHRRRNGSAPSVTNERPTPPTQILDDEPEACLLPVAPTTSPTEHLTMVHPTVAQLIDKIDVTIAKYPSITQYGTFPRKRSVGERRGRRRANSVIAVVVAAEWNLIRGRRTNSTSICTALRSSPPSMVLMGVAACHDQMPFFPSLFNGRARCKVIRLSVIIRQSQE
jgi:hypothetical protein